MAEMSIDSIDVVRELLPNVEPFIPDLADYQNPSAGWTEAEYRHFDAATTHAAVGYWTGEPGEVSFDSWPYTEVCSILHGQVGVEDQYGARKVFGVGQAFIVPKGFRGKWLTILSSKKIFVAIS